MVYNWITNIQNFLLPGRCCLCKQPTELGAAICAPCLGELPRNIKPCPGCALPLPDGADWNQPCGHCTSKPPIATGVYTPYLYAEPVSSLIQQFKFNRKMHLAPLFGRLLAGHLSHWAGYQAPDCIVPVPLHPVRLRQRGFNQSLELARVVAGALHCPVAAQLCRRNRATLTQSELRGQQRRSNVRGAFSTHPEAKGLHIAIIDDVITTGETTHELCRSLLEAGASRVQIWAVARAIIV